MSLIFAVSDVVWQALIAGIVTIYLEWSRRRTAMKVADVERTLADTSGIIANKIDTLDERVEVIHKATNGMKKELVDEVRKASYAKGVKSEVDRNAEEEDKQG